MQTWNASAMPELYHRGLSWDFIPAGTPHYGGIWERVVGMFKRHLAAISSGDVLHVDTFHTVIVEIESILNRRPLTPLSTDSNDVEAITPAHILYPSTYAHSSAMIVPTTSGDDGARLNESWRRARSRINAFWKAWSTEYLALLHTRSKWIKTRKDLAVNDVVILVDESIPRHSWKLARIIHVHTNGSHVRKATVKRSDGKILIKDRTKMVKLELDNINKKDDNG